MKSFNLIRWTFKSFNFPIHAIWCQKNLVLLTCQIKTNLLLANLASLPTLFTVKDITNFENLQTKATKFILNNYTINCKQCFLKLNMLPLKYQLHFYDTCFFINSLKDPTVAFSILNYLCFCPGSTRSSKHNKFMIVHSPRNYIMNFYFKRLPRLWSSLPTIDLSLLINAIKSKLKEILWNNFIRKFDPDNPCTFQYFCFCCKCCSYSPTINFT